MVIVLNASPKLSSPFLKLPNHLTQNYLSVSLFYLRIIYISAQEKALEVGMHRLQIDIYQCR